MIHRLICRLSVLQEWQNSTAPQCKKKKRKIHLKMHLCFQNQASFETSFSIRDLEKGFFMSKENKIYPVFIILNAWPLTWHSIYPSATIRCLKCFLTENLGCQRKICNSSTFLYENLALLRPDIERKLWTFETFMYENFSRHRNFANMLLFLFCTIWRAPILWLILQPKTFENAWKSFRIFHEMKVQLHAAQQCHMKLLFMQSSWLSKSSGFYFLSECGVSLSGMICV